MLLKHIKNHKKRHLITIIDKIEFSAKNLTSNYGVLLLLNCTNEKGMLQALDKNLVFDNKSTEDIKMNHLIKLLCSGFVGTDKFERFFC